MASGERPGRVGSLGREGGGDRDSAAQWGDAGARGRQVLYGQEGQAADGPDAPRWLAAKRATRS